MPEPRTDFRTYLDRTERDQLDARAATAEQERDDALNDRDAYREARDVLRHQLDRLQPLIDAALTWRQWYGNTNPSYASACNDLAAAIDALTTTEHAHTYGMPCPASGCRWPLPDAALGSLPPRAQDDRPRVAPFGCDDCSVEHGQRHRYAGCPANLRQIERDAQRGRRAEREG